MKRKITLLWRPAWLPLALLWLGGLLQSPQALAQEHRLDAEPAEAQIERSEIINTNTPLRIVAPDPQPVALPAAEVNPLLGKACKSDVCDTVRADISISSGSMPLFVVLAGEGEGTIDWGDGTQSVCTVVKDGNGQYDWGTYRHEYSERGVYGLKIYTSSSDVQILCVQFPYYTDYYNGYQLIKNVDVSSCPSLEMLWCCNNHLTSLDVSKNGNLYYLYCSNNRLTSLDISKNGNLYYLYCSNNRLTSLDISKNEILYDLDCSNNQLSSLDICGCGELESLSCDGNFFKVALDADKGFDMSKLPNMDVARIVGIEGGRLEGTRMVFTSGMLEYRYKVGCQGRRRDTALFYMASNWYTEPQIPLTAEFFPDNGFRAYVASFDRDGNDSLCEHERNMVKNIDLSDCAVKNIEGVQYFRNLERLNCTGRGLTSLDVSKNEKLIYLNCASNKLTFLDLSKNTALESLHCFSNPLTSLDLSNNLNLNVLAIGDAVRDPDVIYLYGYGCQLTSLDLSKNMKLKELYCNHNRLTSLDLSNNVNLVRLHCYDNQLTSLNLSNNVDLEWLHCYNNQLTSLDVSKNVELTRLICQNNRLTTLDVSKNVKLEYLWCSDNALTSIKVMEKPEDLSTYGYYGFDARNNRLGWAALTALSEMNGQIYLSPQQQTVELTLNGTLDLSGYMTYEGQPTVCDFSQMPTSAYEWADGRLQIKQVGVWNFLMYNPAVREKDGDSVVVNWNITVYPSDRDTVRWTWKVEADRKNTFYFDMFGDSTFVVNWGDGQDTVLAVSLDRNFGWPGVSHAYAEAGSYEVTVYGNSSRYMLTGLDFYYNHYNWNTQTQNRFDSLSISGANLGSLYCYYNRGLSMLDVSQCESLTSLYCYGNRLDSLDVSACANLTTLRCFDNYLKVLNISRNINLTSLDCSDNSLDSLDVSGCKNLESLDCSDNRLDSLDVSACVNLTSLSCSNNRLDSLDVSACVNLTFLNCSNNHLDSLDVSACVKLWSLYCSSNRLRFLDVSGCEALCGSEYTNEAIGLDCSNNQLTSLDLSKNTALLSLACNNNRLASLDISQDTVLRVLYCQNNRLSLLDVGKNTALLSLKCGGNRMPFAEVAALSAIMQSKNAYEYAFYPQSPVAIEVDLQQGLDLAKLIPVADSGSLDFKIAFKGDTLTEGRGYWVQDGILYPQKVGVYSMRITHDSVKERVYENNGYETRVYVATFDMDVTTSVNDTLRMTWQTLQANETKSFSFEGMIGGYFVVHWGDGDTLLVVSKGEEVTLSHQYAEAGIYEVVLCGIDPLSYVDTAFLKEMSMVKVQGGTFRMGATSEQGSDYFSDERPVHEVTLDSFYIGRYEVTQGQWKAVMGTNPCTSSYGLGDDYPVYYVSWIEAVEFCERLSAKTGRKYRLPTEAEWEYAARGGQSADGTKYAGSNTVGNVAWYGDNSGSKIHPVGQKQPNGLGLYDMSGNVYEWCSDRYGSYSSSSVTNPQGPTNGSRRVVRGGSWNNIGAQGCRVSARGYSDPDRFNYIGFRVVCDL